MARRDRVRTKPHSLWRIPSGLTLALLVVYYAIIIFNVRPLILPSLQLGTWALIMLGGLMMKMGGFVLSGRRRNLLAISRYIGSLSSLVFLGLLIYFQISSGALRKALSSPHWQQFHFFYVALSVFVLVTGSLLYLVAVNAVTWKMLEEIQAVPIATPVFCFGGPELWSKNLSFAQLPATLLSSYSRLSLFAGAIFLMYLMLFYVLRAVTRTGAIRGRWPTYTCFTLFSFGIYLFAVTLVDILLHLLPV